MKRSLDNLTRRNFIDLSAKGSIAASLSIGAMGTFLASCTETNKMSIGKEFKTGFDQTPLPYAYAALEPVIDARTMEIHYTKHAAGYSKNLKAAIAAENVPATATLEDILHKINKYSVTMRNNAGGHYNHELFWKIMRPAAEKNAVGGTLKSALEKNFGSVENFQKEFNGAAATRFGSGWAWLYMDANRKLKIGSTPNQDNPLMSVSAVQGFPLLGIDVWEHAYYLKYQNKRGDYLQSIWTVLDWTIISKKYEEALKSPVMKMLEKETSVEMEIKK